MKKRTLILCALSALLAMAFIRHAYYPPAPPPPMPPTNAPTGHPAFRTSQYSVQYDTAGSPQGPQGSNTWLLHMTLTPIGRFALFGQTGQHGSYNTATKSSTNWLYSEIESTVTPLVSDVGVCRIECKAVIEPFIGDLTVWIVTATAVFADGTSTNASIVSGVKAGTKSWAANYTASGSCSNGVGGYNNFTLVGGIDSNSVYRVIPVNGMPFLIKPPGVVPPPTTNHSQVAGSPYEFYSFQQDFATEDTNVVFPSDWAQVVYWPTNANTNWNILSTPTLLSPFVQVDSASVDADGMVQVFEQATNVQRFYRFSQ